MNVLVYLVLNREMGGHPALGHRLDLNLCSNDSSFNYFSHGLFLQQRPDTLTTGAGHPIGDKLNLQTAGPRGPLLVQDVVFTDEMAHFDRERIPERVVHAKGGGECWPGSRLS